MFAKILIAGASNAGKTTLCKDLEEALIISYDGKPCSLAIPNVNIKEFDSLDNLFEQINTALDKYENKFGKLPKTVVMDSLSTMAGTIEKYCLEQNSTNTQKGWAKVAEDLNELARSIETLNTITNVIMIVHSHYNPETAFYEEVLRGSFKKKGFISTVDYGITIEIKNKKRYVLLKNSGLSRTLLEDYPEKLNVEEFSMQEYLDKVLERIKVSNEYSLN